jgi:hypothetical protein
MTLSKGNRSEAKLQTLVRTKGGQALDELRLASFRPATI